jgi:hypothetical protein
MTLPTVGGSRDTWGAYLVDFLRRSHDEHGNLKDSVIESITAPHEEAIARVDRTFDASRYGTTGTKEAIQAAVDAAELEAISTGQRSIVLLRRGLWTWSDDTGIWIDRSHVHIIGEDGAEIEAPNMQSQVAPVRFQGAISSAITTLTANVTKGDIDITVASSASLAVGNTIILRSAENFNPDRLTASTKGEWATIAAIAGTTVTLAAPVRDSYDNATDTVSIDKVTLIEDVGIHNVKIRLGGLANQHALQVRYCRDIHLTSLDLHDAEYAGAEIRLCLDAKLKDVNTIDVDGRVAGLGHGIRLSGCERVLVEGTTGTRNRHTVDADQGTNEPVCRDVTFRDITAIDNTSAGISTHPSSDNILLEGITAINCGGGIIIRGSNTTLDNWRVVGTHVESDSYYHGLLLGDGVSGGTTPGNGLAGTGLKVRNGTVDITGITGVDTHAIWSSAPMVNATISGITGRGFTSDGMHLFGNSHDNSTIENIDLDCTSQEGVSGDHHGIYFRAFTAADGNAPHRISFDNVRTTDVLGSVIRVEGNTVTGANVSTDLSFSRIRPIGTRNRIVDLANGHFSRVDVDLGTQSSWTGAIVYTSTQVAGMAVRATGTGGPISVLQGPPGSIWQRTDAGPGTALYVKEEGHGSTGWRALGSPIQSIMEYDDFVSGTVTSTTVGKLGWAFAGGTAAVAASEANHPGIVQRHTSSTINTYGYTRISQSAAGSFLPSATFNLDWIVKPGQIDANTDIRIGAANDAGADPGNDGIYLENLGADTNWFLVTRASSSQTRTDTTTAATAAWLNVRIRRVDASTIGVSLNGGTEVTATATIPTAALLPFTAIKNLTGSDKTLQMDYFGLTILGLSR